MAALVEDKTQAEKMASFGFSAVDIGAAAATVDAADGATESAEIDLALDSMNIIKDSLCMACGGSGETRLMLTKIPLFREIILSSFHCDDCGERNTEVQFGGETQEKGCRYELEVSSRADLDRQVVKSESARIVVPALELEIPAATLRGVVTTVEGVLSRGAELMALQPQRLAADVDVGLKVQRVIDDLMDYAAGEALPFSLIVEDPAGNSFVQPLREKDEQLKTSHYDRSDADMVALGFREGGAAPVAGDGEEHMCVTKIPYFKECVIMSFTCEKCGYRNSEVKGGGAVPKLGCAATLTCVDAGDLSRDILKSDTAYVAIPELDLELAHGSLGSVYTTVEGCLEKIVASLRRGNPFQGGDSADGAKKAHFDAFIDKIIALKDGKPSPSPSPCATAANSFVGQRRDAANHGPLDAVGDGRRRRPPDVDDVDTVAVPSNLGTDFHVKPKPRRTVDHPNPTFARGCDDGAPAAQ
ncbi:hypothetical protein JL720_322 [Aureococcus anophagefferens]|nr:hypothetical protein JL720_322 [Aureococcus anophagefferens]